MNRNSIKKPNINSLNNQSLTAKESAREETISTTPAGEIVRVEGEIDERVKMFHVVYVVKS